MLQPTQNNGSKLGQLSYQAPKIPSFKGPSTKNSSPAFAYEGEPTYDKEMDLDNDGTVTFDEFNQYCKDNDISEFKKNQMIQDRIHWQTVKQSLNYAQKGELRYDEEMDTNKDNRVSYDEYIEYLKEKKEEEAKKQQITKNEKEDNKQKASEEENSISEFFEFSKTSETSESPKTSENNPNENIVYKKINAYVEKEAQEESNVELSI